MKRFVIAAVLTAVTLASGAASADPRDDEARVHFAAGVNLLRDPARPRYEEAYSEFKKAYEVSHAAVILGNIGLCAMKLERDSEAVDAYTRYLAEAPEIAADERAQIERDLTTLKATVATVMLESRPAGAMIRDTRVPVQGEPVANTYGPLASAMALGLRRGHHVFHAHFPDGREATWEVDVVGGESHTFEPPPAAVNAGPMTNAVTPEAAGLRPVPTSVFVAGGITVALGIGSLVTGLVASEKHASFEDQNTGADPAKAEDTRSSGQTMNTVSTILLGGVIVGAAVTAYLYLTRPTVAAEGNRMSLGQPTFRF